MTVSFKELNLVPSLQQAVEALGFTTATPVQEKVFPVAMAGGDLMVSSQTGSGKTASFLLPLLQKLIEANPNNKPIPGRAEPTYLVLCPTRELAQQVAADAIDLVKFCRGIRIATIMGGMPYGKQIAQIKGAQVVVATPGRLLDLNDSRAIRLDKVQALVVDEADRMLDLGFAEDLENIHQRCENLQQTLMFSATFAPRIMELAEELVNNPTRIELAHAGDVHNNITQTMHWADSTTHKHKILRHWLADPSLDQAVVFASTQIESEEIAENLRSDGYAASALHGAMPQAVRNRRLDALRKGTTKILVATDVAARGIDVPTISHVINFGLPMKPEDYTHRIGRTGRAGRSGVAITIAQHSERIKIRAIERFTQQPLLASIIPGLEPQKKPEFSGSGRPGGRSSGKRPANRSSVGRSERGYSKNEFGGNQRTSAPRPSFENGESRSVSKPVYEKKSSAFETSGNDKYGKGKISETGKSPSVKKEFSQRNNENPFGEPTRKKIFSNPQGTEQRFKGVKSKEGSFGREKSGRTFTKPSAFRPR